MIIIVKYETIPKIHIKVTVYLRLNQTDHFRTKSCVTCEQSWIIMETHNSTHNNTDQFPYLFNSSSSSFASSKLSFPLSCPLSLLLCAKDEVQSTPEVGPLRSVFIESFSKSVRFHELLYCIYLSYDFIILWYIISIENIIPLLCTIWVRCDKISRIAECLSTVYRSFYAIR